MAYNNVMHIFLDGWKKDLLEHIHADYLPVYLGGRRKDSNGDPKCSSIVSKI